MNNIIELLKHLDVEQARLDRKRKILLEIQPKIEGFPKPLRFTFGGYPESLDIDYLGRADTVEFITFFKAGKWDKQVSNHEGTIDYINKTSLPMFIRIYGAEPPPSCKIEEVPTVIPAQPERVVMIKKLVCPKGVLKT